jgi:hypothetical protein
MSGLRLSKEAKRAQYEMPGFSAGVCVARLDRALLLFAHFRERYGSNVLVENIVDCLFEVRQSLIDWQMYAQMVTDYEMAHRATREERENA